MSFLAPENICKTTFLTFVGVLAGVDIGVVVIVFHIYVIGITYYIGLCEICHR